MRDITEILRKSGMGPGKTRKLIENLKRSRRSSFAKAPQIFSSAQAKEYGIDIPDDWMLKIYETKEGVSDYSFLTSDKTEVKLEDIRVTEMGEWTTKLQLEKQEAETRELQESFKAIFPNLNIENVYSYAGNEPEAFLTDVLKAGRTPETEILLGAMFPEATDEQLDELFSPVFIAPKPLKQMPLGSYSITWQPLENVRKYASEDFEQFRQAVMFEGRSPETEALLKRVYPGIDENYLEKFFLEDSIAYKFVRGEWLPDALEDYWKLFWGGTGELAGSLAGAAERIGNEGLADSLREIGRGGQVIAGDVFMGEPDTPEWYAKNLTRMVPMILALIDTALITAGGSGAIVTAMGGGTFLSRVVMAISGGVTATVGEGAMEAGMAYDEAKYRGYSQDEINAVFDKTMRGNVELLSLTNTAQFAAGFCLPGGRTAGWLAKSLIFGFEAASEGLEEGAQLMITRNALGDIQKFDKEFWENFKLGCAGGAIFGGVAQLYRNIQGRAEGRMSPEQLDTFNKDKAEAMLRGLSETEATEKAMNNFAATGEGGKVIDEVVDELTKEERAEASERVSKVEDAVKSAFPEVEIPEATVHEPMKDIQLRIKEARERGQDVEALLNLPSDDFIVESTIGSDYMRSALQKVAKVEPAKKVIGTFLGKRILTDRQSQIPEHVIGRAKAIYAFLLGRGESAQAMLHWRLYKISPDPIKLFNLDKNAYSREMANCILSRYGEVEVAGTVEHIFTHPEMYDWKGKKKGLEYITEYHKLTKEISVMLEAEGLNPDVVSHDWYYKRVVVGKYDKAGELVKIRSRGAGGRVGKRVGYEFHRKAPTMMEGMTWGIVYGRNPSESISSYLEEATKKIADKRVIDYLSEFGEKPTNRLKKRHPELFEDDKPIKLLKQEELADAAKLHSAINRVSRGEKIPEQTLRAIAKRFPEQGRKLRALMQGPTIVEGQLRDIVAQDLRTVTYLTERLEKIKPVEEKPLRADMTAKARADIEAEARILVPNDQKLVEAFELWNYEDRLAFREAMAGRFDEIGKVVAEQQVELAGIEEFLKTDPVALYRGSYGKQKRSLTSLLDEYGRFPETLSKGEARIILMGRQLKPNVLDKAGRVRWEYVLDELADHFNMSEQELINSIESVYHQKQTAKDLRAMVGEATDSLSHIEHMLELMDRVDTTPEFVPEPEIPQALPGMPEAGLQKDMFGFTTPVFPEGKAEYATMSMDDYNKLCEMRKEAGLPAPDVIVKPKIEGVEGLEAETEIRAIRREVPEAKTAKERAAGLETLRREAVAITEARKVPYWKSTTEYTLEMEKVKRPGIGEGYLMEPFAGGRIYNQEFIDEFNRFFGHDKGLPGMSATADAAGVLRITKAALDLSYPAIQGQLGWGLANSYIMSNPKSPIGYRMMGQWMKAFLWQIGAFINPGIVANYMTRHNDTVKQRIAAGGSARAIIMFQEMQQVVGKGRLARFAEAALNMIPGKPFARAEASFMLGGELIRDGFWEILAPEARKNGEAGKLAHNLDLITGISDPRAMGIPLSERQLEQSWLLFSTAYTRSYLTILNNIFRGGMDGAHARRAVAGLIGGGSLFYVMTQYALSALQGKDDDECWEDIRGGLGIKVDPLTGEWEWRPTSALTSLKIGDTYYGLGGGIYGLTRLLGNISATVQEIGGKERIDLVRIMKYGSFNKRDNPFIAWWWNRSSALTSAIYELATGREYLGYPIEGWDGYIKHIVKLFEPIWLEQGINPYVPFLTEPNYPKAKGPKEAILRVVGELLGLRVNPEYLWEQAINAADDIANNVSDEFLKKYFPDLAEFQKIKGLRDEDKLKWEHLPKPAQARLRLIHPDLEEKFKAAEQDSAFRQTGLWKEWTGASDRARNEYKESGHLDCERVRKGEIDTGELWKYLGERGKQYGISLEALESLERFSEIYDRFEKSAEEGAKYDLVMNVAFEAYKVLRFSNYDDEFGDFDYDARNADIKKFIEKYGQETYDICRLAFVDKRLVEGFDPLQLKRSEDSDKLGRGYWSLPYQAIYKMTEDDFAKGKVPDEFRSRWLHLQTLKTDEEIEAYLEDNPELRTNYRAEWRFSHPEEDAILAFWGKGKLQSKEAYDLAVKMGKEYGVPLTQMGLGLPPNHLLDNYFEYNKIIKEFGGNSAEAKLYKLEYSEWFEFGKEEYNWDLVTTSAKSLKISVKWRELEDKYESYADRKSINYIEDKDKRKRAREQLLLENPLYSEDRYRRDAYDIDFPEERIEDYVSWKASPQLDKDTSDDFWWRENAKETFYEDDWWLMEHPEFVKAMLDAEEWTKAPDFSKVPSREVHMKYRAWKKLPLGQERRDYEAANPDLDMWLHITKGTKLESEKR